MQFAASQPDPWDIPATLACEKLQLIWDAIFPDIEHTVTTSSAVYLLVSIHSCNRATDNFLKQALQRLADSWRNNIGSAAIAILIAYFESPDELRDTDESRAEFADYALDKLRFCFKKADGDDEEVSVYLLCSVYIHIYTTQRRIFGDFTKVPLFFKLLVNTSMRSMVLEIFLVFMIQTTSLVELSLYQSQRYVIILPPENFSLCL